MKLQTCYDHFNQRVAAVFVFSGQERHQWLVCEIRDRTGQYEGFLRSISKCSNETLRIIYNDKYLKRLCGWYFDYFYSLIIAVGVVFYIIGNPDYYPLPGTTCKFCAFMV